MVWFYRLMCVTADHLQAILASVRDNDTLLVTDGRTRVPRYAAALGVSHDVLGPLAGERVRGELQIQTSIADTPH